MQLVAGLCASSRRGEQLHKRATYDRSDSWLVFGKKKRVTIQTNVTRCDHNVTTQLITRRTALDCGRSRSCSPTNVDCTSIGHNSVRPRRSPTTTIRGRNGDVHPTRW